MTVPETQASDQRSVPPPAGWYPNSAGPGQRYWDGSQWTATQQAPAPAAREAYMVDRRVRAARIIVFIAAGIAMLGIVGSVSRYVYEQDHNRTGHRAGLVVSSYSGVGLEDGSIFDVANTQDRTFGGAVTTVHRPGWAFLLVPPLIMLVLPIVRRRAVAGDGTLRIAYTGGYVARVLTAFLLWALGLSLWISKLFQLSDEGQTILTGAYVGVAILSLGLIATLAVLPFRLRVVRVDVAGNVVGAGRPAVHAPAPEAIRSSAEHDE